MVLYIYLSLLKYINTNILLYKFDNRLKQIPTIIRTLVFEAFEKVEYLYGRICLNVYILIVAMYMCVNNNI